MGNQMREYTKPIMNVERFIPNITVAACTTTLNTNVTYAAQTVNCLIEGSESIFTATTSGCGTAVDTSSNYFITYNGTNYYLWQTDGATSGEPPVNDSLLKEILSSEGLSNDNADKQWHVGTYQTTLEEYYTNSY